MYQNGETFQPSCKHQCTCIDGAVGCVQLCLQELSIPALGCLNPTLVKVPGQCCDKWVCEDTDNLKVKKGQTKAGQPDENLTQKNKMFSRFKGKPQAGQCFSTLTLMLIFTNCNKVARYNQSVMAKLPISEWTLVINNVLKQNCCPKYTSNRGPSVAIKHYEIHWVSFPTFSAFRGPPVTRILSSGQKCVTDSTSWSPCSKTCGVGVSTRVTNNNPQCKLVKESRICQVRPCSPFPQSGLKVSIVHNLNLVYLGMAWLLGCLVLKHSFEIQ